MALYEKITVVGDNITLSLVVWRRFQRQMPGLVERILDINQNLAALGNYIPVGTTFLLPIERAEETVLDQINLW